ncbi:MAG: sigma factor G inhibitor Gin [Candidatus Cohnella colombiensis]|uniref:Sigma factor G inhibitor Gin n=1 Tax=Candidatus Cohnella colombiensis TaxID=3121368 RepID=A0AA95EW73_9BACL|nr:MAG: sigma factor G inhibitor Gin [Cohnella sp.]
MDTQTCNTCIVCEQPKAEGITIIQAFICTSCELAIVRTKVEDEQYPFFVKQLRQLQVRSSS